MKLNFTKMHGLGNDFVVIDAINQNVSLSESICRHISDRRFGIGCDQILLIEAAKLPDTDFHYGIINADGTDAGACGNGARCFAHFVRQKGLCNKQTIRVGTSSGTIVLRHLDNDLVEVDMGTPNFEPDAIPFISEQQSEQYTIELADEQQTISAVSMGNPHAVMLVADTEFAPVLSLGPLIERHQQFPQRTNVGFLQVINPTEVKLRVYERGTGETLACGSGACAAVAVGHQLGLLEDRVIVHLRGGDLVVQWSGPGSNVYLKGPAETVFEGAIEI
jgi:diaminopimelate epimerase